MSSFLLRVRATAIAAMVAASFVSAHAQGPGKRPLTLDDLLSMKRVSEPQVSPDGSHVVYVLTEVLKDENRTQADLWLVATSGGNAAPRRLTSSPKNERHPRWSPDGKWIAFESNRDGDYQIYLLPLAGGEAQRITSLSTGATGAVWSPTGGKLAFQSEIYAEFSDKPFAEADHLNKQKSDADAKGPVKARVIDKLLYRHWDSWVGGKRQHVFVVPVKDGAASGEPRNVTPGENDAVPTSSTFSAGDEYAFSPDGKSLAFAAPPVPLREQAWSTNHDIFIIDLESGKRRQVTTAPGADTFPRFSPDGKSLAYRSQERAGFEADKWQIKVIDLATGQPRSLTQTWDRSAESFLWSPDSRQIYFTAAHEGTEPIWSVAVTGTPGSPKQHTKGGIASDLSITSDGGIMVFNHADATKPANVHAMNVSGPAETQSPRGLTRENAELVAQLDLPRLESVTMKGAGDAPVQMWLLKPPGFDAKKKYPLVFWVHGGPQGAWMDAWGYRWNPQIWAAQGYVIALPNPRGSTSFGQKFTDDISRDWGGKVFDDLVASLAWLEQQPYIDPSRMAAAGASYGGYMMNWFQGHTDKFKTLVTHCGVYNLESMYGTTEELWFAEWDTGIPWKDEDQLKWSPHKYAAKFKTPNLIIHNELDFRVPLSEGMQLFTALQRQGVPSKLIIFPDEGHWVNKPANSEFWHREIFDWLAEYLKK